MGGGNVICIFLCSEKYLKGIDMRYLLSYNYGEVIIMFKVVFYKNSKGEQPVKNYLYDLSLKSDKDSHIKLRKIEDYINILRTYGTRAGKPYVDHIEGDIWELRPLRERILFFCWQGDCFVMLHHFKKKTRKTPKKEIDQAKRNLKSFIERSANNEN